ncbi:hypothetical protein HOD19_01560 [bacterium]|jgi:hypothetical protein|nr:hypothetical protein [bacterium]MBT4649053.1 hypothetical protein [bacterium]
MFDDLNQQLCAKNKTWRDKVRDFWLPNKNNDYHPHSLQFRRLFFYTTSALIMKVIVVVFVVLLPVTAWLTPNILEEESKKVVSLTNQIRVDLNLNPLLESSILNQAAYNKVDDMLLEQYFAHISPNGNRVSTWLKNLNYNYFVAGENLAMGFVSAEDVVAAWQNSPTHNANLIDPLYTEVGVSMINGLYNDMDTTLVAQFFAKPFPVSVVEEESPAQDVIIEPEIEENIVQQENDLNNALIIEDGLGEQEIEELEDVPDLDQFNQPEVLGEQEIERFLVQPIILSPIDGFFLKTEKIVLEIEAQAAEKIVVYDNDSIIFSTDKNPNLDNISFLVNLTEGEHQVYVEARNGQEKMISAQYSYQVDLTAPSVNLEKTKIIVDQPVGKSETLVKIDAYLSNDVFEAKVSLAGNLINLAMGDLGHWSALLVLSKEEAGDILSPVILPSLQAIDFAGNKTIVDLSFDQIKPVKTSLVSQYFFLRNNQLNDTKTLFNISIIYYKVFALLLIIALALNIFIHIKKQDYKVIGSTIIFLGLLGLLIIF